VTLAMVFQPATAPCALAQAGENSLAHSIHGEGQELQPAVALNLQHRRRAARQCLKCLSQFVQCCHRPAIQFATDVSSDQRGTHSIIRAQQNRPGSCPRICPQ
jgi:hypothetical protein